MNERTFSTAGIVSLANTGKLLGMRRASSSRWRWKEWKVGAYGSTLADEGRLVSGWWNSMPSWR